MIHLASPRSYALDESTGELVLVCAEAPAPDHPDPVSFVSEHDHVLRLAVTAPDPAPTTD
ncbi:hypothetical protein [Cellulomonas sp. C5510]|uniref:hypothetical protein n=1 Tax=Cellulomonas sp. C5510 TaxID=2871170 RepID=UPI001C95DAF5|nr:hypothetical protein [Cellulomonas sp. C5510]QZN86605.1 hypothetical protein K5O09_05510 [Cellulomonas sp. C5510]